jgi:hypothetical protein
MEANKLSGFQLVNKEPYVIPNNGLPVLAIITLLAEIRVRPVNIVFHFAVSKWWNFVIII